jgi:hypothetical protein
MGVLVTWFDTRCGEGFAGRIVGPFRGAVLA